jgi:putative transposase
MMGIHPKSIYKKKGNKRMRYSKKEDLDLLGEIKNLLQTRSTYGYKRITAMLNQKRKSQGLATLNKKRIHRIMSIYGLLLPKNAQLRQSPQKTGKVMTLHSNIRWSSDCFEIKCFNGEKVYVSFALDCCDREIIAYVAKSFPILSEDIQSLMIECVEKRFKNTKTDRQVEFLSDRGSIYRAYQVQLLAQYLGLKSCFTAAYSPESNGMSEAFVKTIKRDYVYVSDCYDAQTVLNLMPKWIEDYNNNAPHSALKMKSPKQFRASHNLVEDSEQDARIMTGQDQGRSIK